MNLVDAKRQYCSLHPQGRPATIAPATAQLTWLAYDLSQKLKTYIGNVSCLTVSQYTNTLFIILSDGVVS